MFDKEMEKVFDEIENRLKKQKKDIEIWKLQKTALRK